MSIGDRIKQRRLEIGLTVDQVAAKIQKNRATVYRYESSEIEKFPIDILAPLAEALCTTPAYLMGWTDSSAATPPPASQPSNELTTEEQRLIQSFRSLNAEGQQKILDYTADLCASGRYIKTASDSSLPKQA